MKRLAPILILLVATPALAETVQVEVVIREIKNNTITVSYKTGLGESTIDLIVSPKAEVFVEGQKRNLRDLSAGTKATVHYNKDFEIVTKIEAVKSNWATFLMNRTPDDSFFSATEDGILIGEGQGYLQSARSFTDDFAFEIEYRFRDNQQTLSSRKLPYTNGMSVALGLLDDPKDKGWPRSVEAKLNPKWQDKQMCVSGVVTVPGDIPAELPLTGQTILGQAGSKGNRFVLGGVEAKELPEWNKLELLCQREKGNFVVKINGELVNGLKGVKGWSGRIYIFSMDVLVKLRNPVVTMKGREFPLDFEVGVAK